MNLDIAEIKVEQRKRRLDHGKVQSLADSFASIGQLQPITVVKDDGMYRLIAGLHRLEAAKYIGWQTIEASAFEGGEVEAELAEIDENLMRNDLTVLEQGEHLARRQELVGRKVGRPEINGDILSPLKTQSEIAADIGLTERSAQRRMQAARNITPEVKDAIRETEIANSTTQLLELARLQPEVQLEVAKFVTDGASSIAEAYKQMKHKPHVNSNSGENEWYTPPKYIEAARRAMGSIDTDPASCELANAIVKAKAYFDIDDDGLSHAWEGNVWLNPPYVQPLVSQFTAALVDKYLAGEINQACVLVNNATETGFFQYMLPYCSAVCFPSGRIRYIDKNGEQANSPLQGQAILYFGNEPEQFANFFKEIGGILYANR